SHACSSQRCLSTSMATTHYDYIELFWVDHLVKERSRPATAANIYKRGQEATKRNKIPDTGGLKRGQDREEGPIILPVSPETSCDKYENGNYVRAWCFTWNLGRSRSAVALMEVTLGSDKLQKFGAASSLYAQSL